MQWLVKKRGFESEKKNLNVSFYNYISNFAIIQHMQWILIHCVIPSSIFLKDIFCYICFFVITFCFVGMSTRASPNLRKYSDRYSKFWFVFASKCWKTGPNWLVKGGFKSEDTGEFLLFQNKYSKSLSWVENFNKLFTLLGGKFKFSA